MIINEKKQIRQTFRTIKELIKAIYQRHKGRYGYRLITDELQNRAIIINHKTVLRLMNLLELKSIIRVKKYKSYKGENDKIAPNILERNFKAEAPNQKWATDITEFNVLGSKLYLSPIIDLFNQEIISYELNERPVFNQVVMMFKRDLREYQMGQIYYFILIKVGNIK